MEEPAPATDPASPADAHSIRTPAGYAWERLEGVLGWYEAKAQHDGQWFHRLKVAQIVLAAAIPVTAGAGATAWITGSLGASIVVLEGLQQLFQFQQNWTGYRSAAEALKREKYLYLARADPYSGLDAAVVLAAQVEQHVAQEHATWSSERANKRAAKP